MTGPPSPLIEDYLREVGFWHVAMIGLGSVHSADWGVVCYELLGAIPDNINGGQIDMGWLRDTFPEPDDDSTELELQIIRGYLMLDLSRNLVHLRWLLKLVDFRAAGELSWMCGATRPNKAKIGGCLSLLQSWARFRFPFLPRLPTCLEDIRLLLEQRSEAQFQWTPPYEDLAIRTVFPDEYLQNPNAWHVVNFAIVEMHQSDRVLRQFGFRQPIPVLEDHHKINLQQLHTDWPRFWSHYIQMWEDRYDYIPTREPIIVPELACVPEYMPWFRIHGKPYLLSEEERQRQLRVQRERRGPLNPRRRDDDAGPSIVPTQSPGPSPGPTVQPSTPTAQPLQMMPGTYPSPFMYPSPYMFPFSSPMAGWNVWPGSSPFSITPSGPLIYRQPSHEGLQEGPSGSSSFYQSSSPYGFQTPPPLMMQTPPQSLFYQDGSSSQHPQPESSPEQAQPPLEAGQRRNPMRNRRRPSCGTESDRHGH
ncbi:hypothetical protein GOBAR_AA33801 [Gossypium barbadense]|uniref:Aminotransferase-like plant mobile domain-containing protein n=1 Tax=Gossypium barbadense TaxID=3634 RepID=A0A2P5W707_GOSBA|nr:hypothetical protein GOBAR_AA33801 [Gossypium barbadense]